MVHRAGGGRDVHRVGQVDAEPQPQPAPALVGGGAREAEPVGLGGVLGQRLTGGLGGDPGQGPVGDPQAAALGGGDAWLGKADAVNGSGPWAG